MKKLNILLCDNHLTFWFTREIKLAENTLNFSAIDISKATLKLKFTGAPSQQSSCSLKIEYYDQSELKWKKLGEITQNWCGIKWCPDKEGTIDVTPICQSNPNFKYRPVITLGFWTIYHSCMQATATLELEYTTGTVEGTGYTGDMYYGDINMLPIAQLLSTVMAITMITIMFELITSTIGGIYG